MMRFYSFYLHIVALYIHVQSNGSSIHQPSNHFDRDRIGLYFSIRHLRSTAVAIIINRGEMLMGGKPVMTRALSVVTVIICRKDGFPSDGHDSRDCRDFRSVEGDGHKSQLW